MDMIRNETILKKRLIPMPVELTLTGDGFLKLRDGVKFVLRSNAPEAAELARTLSKRYWSIAPDLQAAAASAALPPEGYKLNITPDALEIDAPDLAGVRHAFQTLRQLAEPERNVERFQFYLLPQLTVGDYPAFAFRGLHLCWFPETEAWQIEKQLRMAAYYKFNCVILEPWGIFPYQSHPELSWPDRRIDPAELKRLIHLGRELGVTVCPQLNLLGHGSGSRVMGGKHAFLGYDPALQSLQEPDGWTWCLTNPETRRILTDAVLELYDFFEQPPYFHLGCDEAYRIGTCASCRNHALHDLVLDHIRHFHGLLKERNCRSIIWHDMLLNREDPRWEHYIVCGHAENHLDKLYQELPHDLIIADWQYDYPRPNDQEPTWPTTKFFQSEGFDVFVCPWHNFKGAMSLSATAAAAKMAGVLMTSWHQNYAWHFQSIFFAGSQGSWNPAQSQGVSTLWDGGSYGSLIGFHTRQMDWDMGVHEYRKSGFTTLQVPIDNYPG